MIILEIEQTLRSWCQISFLETLHLKISSIYARKYDAFLGEKKEVLSKRQILTNILYLHSQSLKNSVLSL